jgi:small subunit ribosomal protein S20
LSHKARLFRAPPTPLSEIELPNIASAKKNMRKSRAAMARNRAQRSALRTALKKGHSPEVDAAERLTAVSLLDRAARKGLIHPNAAARHKSRMAKKAGKK